MSYYFSRAQLRPASAISLADRNWLREHSLHGEVQLDHELIWRLFPSDGMARDFVFRHELSCSYELNTSQSYLVVSKRQPEANSMFTVESKPYAPRIDTGERLYFDLRANPVVSRSRKGRETSRRHDVLMDAKKRCADFVDWKNVMHKAALDWLVGRAKNWGLEIHVRTVVMKNYRQHSFSGRDKKVSFSVLDYSGLATVVNPEELLLALTRGVGSARSYGCGLLLVRRG